MKDLEDILVSTYKGGMIAYLNSHPENFAKAIKLAISDNQPFSWRAAWLLWASMTDDDPRIKVYLKSILNSIKGKDDGHQRELLKILLRMELNKKQEAYLLDLCLCLWEQPNKRPSVRYTAFKFILKIAKKHPHLAREIECFISEQYMTSLSPGVKHSISRMIKESGIKISQHY